MPIPGGEITTTEIWNNPAPEPKVEEPKEEKKEEL